MDGRTGILLPPAEPDTYDQDDRRRPGPLPILTMVLACFGKTLERNHGGGILLDYVIYRMGNLRSRLRDVKSQGGCHSFNQVPV